MCADDDLIDSLFLISINPSHTETTKSLMKKNSNFFNLKQNKIVFVLKW